MKERDYYREKCEYKKDEEHAGAESKAIAVNKNWNILTMPENRGGGYGQPGAAGAGSMGPNEYEPMWGRDEEEDGLKAEAVAQGKAVIFNKNINIVKSSPCIL